MWYPKYWANLHRFGYCIIEDEYDLAQKISLLATDRELYKRLSANARETYESKFTLRIMGN